MKTPPRHRLFFAFLLGWVCLLHACNLTAGSDQSATEGNPLSDRGASDGNATNPVPVSDGFDFPVGPPDAKKYYNAQGFQKNQHLGEDWNGNGGGNTDKGDPVFAIANAKVVVAEDFGSGWGNVVRLLHNIGTKEHPRLIESLYAHLDKMNVKVGDILKRGEQLGTIGDAHGAYWAHLHLEMRWKPGMELGGGYGTDTTGFLVPTKFIRSHRP